ncbi:keratin-associated protein 19-2-like [Daphnia pulicaria]|uniref:keratin-associated protein 19-2-like n=1 Tax=Daphnia pulicaria TaxID=35523 RepID=UPI001EEA21DC|nr:keratin-associated protein 19-2-like [Daphnia pulicaria]
MVPTIYGLRLDNHVELGASAILNLRRRRTHPVSLRWKKARRLRSRAAGAAGSADGRPKRQFGLGYLIGSALGGGYGYGRPYGGYGGYGGYGRPSGYGGYGGYGHGHHPYHNHGHGYGYGR